MTVQLSPKEQEVADNMLRLLEEHPQLKAARTPFQKRLAVMPILKQLRAKIAIDEKEIRHKNEAIEFCESVLKASEQFPEWQKLPPKLEKNDCSRLHNLVAFLKLQDKYMGDLRKGDDPNTVPWPEVVPFVVQHDWAAAFRNATDYDGSFKLPYEMCAFEFRITGKSVTVLAFQGEEQEPAFTAYCHFGDYWVSSDDQATVPHVAFALEQIKAICVALDAQVAAHEVVRASAKVNKRREAENKVPFFSYHVVSLARRGRVANVLPGIGTGTRRRLHFRRGHWRHYEKFKTWVRWCLVGDPELGFIDKEYRL